MGFGRWWRDPWCGSRRFGRHLCTGPAAPYRCRSFRFATRFAVPIAGVTR